MKLWSENNSTHSDIIDFTVGNDYILDQELIKYDCMASIAHVKMLYKINLLTKKEREEIILILKKIIRLSKNNQFQINKEDEDCHTAIESFLIKKLGNLGKKIHIGRSRNDQILTALRLYYKVQIEKVINYSERFIITLNNFKNKYGSIDIPGYTHYQKAMPSSIKLWTNAIIDSMKDNIKLITVIKKLTNQSPLGSAAGYNNYIKYDKKYCSEELGFNKVQYNPIYVQNSRGKFESSIIHGLNQIMYDLNKIASDIIFFSLSETSYFILSEKITTGSSIMPHKKNPDVLEILRANYHKTLAYEYFIKNNISNLISGYNRDIQLTKEPIINSFKILKESLHIINIVFKNIEININNCKKAMTYELYSTNEILEKISKSGNFRDAYFQISKKYNNSVSGG